MAQSLFDPSLLLDLDFSKTLGSFTPSISPSNPGAGLVMRPLEKSDHGKGFLDLLSQLTKVGSVDVKQFADQFQNMKETRTHYVIVVEDLTQSQVVACATLLVEYKFIHSASRRGRIEDLVVLDSFRGKQLGKLLIETCIKLSQKFGCYKISLDADTLVKPFYEKFGFKDGSTLFMQLRFFD